MILLDIILPHLNGLRILESVRKNSKNKNFHTPIVLLSNLGQDEIVTECMSFGARGFILKSNYNPEEFIIAVRAFLNQSKNEKK